MLQRDIRQIEPIGHKACKVFFDRRLVLRRRRYDPRMHDAAVRRDFVMVIDKTARRLCSSAADTGPRFGSNERLVRLFIGTDDSERLFHRVHRLDRPHDDTAERVRASLAQTGFACRLLGGRRQLVEVQAVSGERPDKIRPTAHDMGLKRRRVLDMRLFEMLVVLLDRNVYPLAGDDPPFVQGIFLVVAQRDEFVIPLVIWEIELGDEPHHVQGRVARPFQIFDHRPQVAFRRHFVETADLDVDRMNFTAAHHGHDVVADLLEPQRGANEIAVILRHVDCTVVTEEVRRMQHVDVEHVAFDPFATIEKPAQLAQRSVNLDTENLLHRVHRTHLVGHRADTADASRDVGCFHIGTAAQKRFVETRRFKDPEFCSLHSAIANDHLECAFALHAGEIVYLDGLTSHGACSLRGMLRRSR